MSPTVALLLAALLIAGNGFFVGVEFALLAARQTKLTGLAENSRSAQTALRASQRLPLMISGCQFGITICSLGLGAVGEPAVSHLLDEPVFEAVRLPVAAIHPGRGTGKRSARRVGRRGCRGCRAARRAR
jgi:CBS domain containing-hemolysin-like protein